MPNKFAIGATVILDGMVVAKGENLIEQIVARTITDPDHAISSVEILIHDVLVTVVLHCREVEVTDAEV